MPRKAPKAKTASSVPKRTGELRPALAIGLILFACYAYFFYMGGNWNIESRLALVHAIVEEKTLAIDSYESRTQDKAFYDGHYYCDKAVGASFLGVPVYAAFRPLLASRGPQSLWATGNYLVNLFVTAIPSAVAGALFFLLLGRFLPAAVPRIWLTLAYGLGTLAFPYATMFFGHQTAAALLVISFFLLFRMRSKKWSPPIALVAGLLAGYALITDFLAVAVVLGLVIYAIATVKKSAPSSFLPFTFYLLPFLLGLLAPLPLQLWYNQACFGSPFASAYHYEVLAKFREGMSAGMMGLTYPKLEALYQLTIGPRRGLLYCSPFLLFTIPGAYLMIRRREHRAEGLLCAGVGLLSILLNSAYYLWWGGGVYGPRFLIPAIPFIALPVIFAIRYSPMAFKLLAITAIVFTAVVVVTTPLIPEPAKNPIFEAAFRDLFRRGLLAAPNFNFNLMMYFGLDDLRSLFPLLALVGIGLVYLRSLRLP